MDIKDLILKQLPDGIIDQVAEKAGVKKDDIEKIFDKGTDEIVKHGQETEGGLFDNLENKLLSKAIATKTGLEEGTVSKVLEVGLPFIKKYVDADELIKIVKGLSDGVDMEDIKNIADAVFNNDDDKKTSNSQENKGGSGILGSILGSIFGGKK